MTSEPVTFVPSMSGKMYYPVLLPFPIWHYGPIYDFDNRYVRDGWHPVIYGQREVPPDGVIPTFRGGTTRVSSSGPGHEQP
jgi:hypothetical protein